MAKLNKEGVGLTKDVRNGWLRFYNFEKFLGETYYSSYYSRNKKIKAWLNSIQNLKGQYYYVIVPNIK